jgi:hypothetical protein
VQLDRSKLKEIRRAIVRANASGDENVFAQVQDGGTWKPVEEITVVGGIVWTRLRGEAGSYMAHDVRLINELPPGVAAAGSRP